MISFAALALNLIAPLGGAWNVKPGWSICISFGRLISYLASTSAMNNLISYVARNRPGHAVFPTPKGKKELDTLVELDKGLPTCRHGLNSFASSKPCFSALTCVR